MQITRNHHLRYMAKLTPVLIVLYLAQILIYQHYLPTPFTSDMCLLIGVGLAMIIGLYQFYDHHHKVIFHHNYLEMNFEILKMKTEILYQKIHNIEFTKTSKDFGHITLHLKDGSVQTLFHLDSPENIVEFLNKKIIGPT